MNKSNMNNMNNLNGIQSSCKSTNSGPMKFNSGSKINNIKGFTNSCTSRYSAPIDFNTGDGVLGSYDNILLKTSCGDATTSPPCNGPEKSKLMFLPQGTPLPLKNEMIFAELPKDSMFMFAQTYASPYCNSAYSTDRGQLCVGDLTRKFLGEERGGNQTYNNYNF